MIKGSGKNWTNVMIYKFNSKGPYPSTVEVGGIGPTNPIEEIVLGDSVGNVIILEEQPIPEYTIVIIPTLSLIAVFVLIAKYRREKK